MTRIVRLTAPLGIAVCCLAMSACNKVERLDLSNATLEGTVTYKGKAVPYALVIVTGEGKGKASTENAGRDGKFKIAHVPLGAVQIGVNSDAAKGKMMSEVMAAKKGSGPIPAAVDVPEKYFDPATSGITTTISDGANTLDIKLE